MRSGCSALGSRPDTLAYLVGPLFLVCVLVGLRAVKVHHVLALVAGMLVPAAVGTIDLYQFSRGYASALHSNIRLLAFACAAALALGIVLGSVVRLWPQRIHRWHARISPVASWFVAALAALGSLLLWMRPSYMHVTGDGINIVVRALEEKEGLVGDGSETFAEHTQARAQIRRESPPSRQPSR